MSYDITCVFGPKDMRLKKYILMSQIICTMAIIMNFNIEYMEQSIHYNAAFKVVFVQFAYCPNHVIITSDT